MARLADDTRQKLEDQVDSHALRRGEADAGEGPPKPKLERSSRTTGPLSREQILDATAVCLHRHGYDGTKIRKIADLLGCAVGSIYRYFEDKREVLTVVTQRRFEDVAARAEAGETLATTTRAYCETAAAELEQYQLMFWLASIARPQAAGDGDPPSGSLPPMVRRVIAAWSEELGEEHAARRLWSQIHGDLMMGLSVQTILADLPASADRASVRTADIEPVEDLTLL